jgi:hypothetical protein
MKTIDLATLVTVTGGNLSSSISKPRPPDTLPRPFPLPRCPPTKPEPTIPLGPFYPQRNDIA